VRRKDPCWSMGTIYDHRELSGVSIVGPGVDGVLQWYQSRPSWFHGRVWVRGSGIWCMAHVGLEWSHYIAYDDTRHTYLAKRGGSWIGVDRLGHRSSKGGEL
jgi:hypothetical protein